MSTFEPNKAYLWFAWRPVFLSHGGIAWLKDVARTRIYSHQDEDWGSVYKWHYSRLGYEPGVPPQFRDAEEKLAFLLTEERAAHQKTRDLVSELLLEREQLTTEHAAAKSEGARLMDKYSYQELGYLRLAPRGADPTEPVGGFSGPEA